MGKAIINVSNDFFDVGGKEQDVMYNFRGNNGIRKGSVLYGKTINLSKMYDSMLEYVREFLFGGEYVSIIGKVDKIGGSLCILRLMNKYTTKKYGISIDSVYNKIHGNVSSSTMMNTDILYNELKVKYGMTGIDWMYLYNNMKSFFTNDDEILEYICNSILSNEIYEYFVTENNLRYEGMARKVSRRIKNNVMVATSDNFVKVEWNNGGKKEVSLGKLIRSHNHWWSRMTYTSNSSRHQDRKNIRNYDILIKGRSVTEVFPKYCPVFSNLRMNYTSIDFDGKSNLKKCSEIAGYSDKGETWSFASIDRIDSNKGYSYDNIRIISHYANHLKNVGNIDQMRILLRYMDEQSRYF